MYYMWTQNRMLRFPYRYNLARFLYSLNIMMGHYEVVREIDSNGVRVLHYWWTGKTDTSIN